MQNNRLVEEGLRHNWILKFCLTVLCQSTCSWQGSGGLYRESSILGSEIILSQGVRSEHSSVNMCFSSSSAWMMHVRALHIRDNHGLWQGNQRFCLMFNVHVKDFQVGCPLDLMQLWNISVKWSGDESQSSWAQSHKCKLLQPPVCMQEPLFDAQENINGFLHSEWHWAA